MIKRFSILLVAMLGLSVTAEAQQSGLFGANIRTNASYISTNVLAPTPLTLLTNGQTISLSGTNGTTSIHYQECGILCGYQMTGTDAGSNVVFTVGAGPTAAQLQTIATYKVASNGTNFVYGGTNALYLGSWGYLAITGVTTTSTNTVNFATNLSALITFKPDRDGTGRPQ